MNLVHEKFMNLVHEKFMNLVHEFFCMGGFQIGELTHSFSTDLNLFILQILRISEKAWRIN